MEKPAQLRLPDISEKDQARFWSKVALPNGEGCMLWLGSTNDNGYGRFWLNGRNEQAHRVSYILAYGPIPDGLEVDHVKAKGCTHRHCTAGGHLEAVTHMENTLRGDTITAENATKAYCPQGHPYSGENLYITPDGRRDCRTCGRVRTRRYRERKAA